MIASDLPTFSASSTNRTAMLPPTPSTASATVGPPSLTTTTSNAPWSTVWATTLANAVETSDTRPVVRMRMENVGPEVTV